MVIYFIINILQPITDKHGVLGLEPKMEDATKWRLRSGWESGSSST